MKIISPFRDYYDSVGIVDKETLFVCKPFDIVLSSELTSRISIIKRKLREKPISNSIEIFIIGFCGKIYPCFKLNHMMFEFPFL